VVKVTHAMGSRGIFIIRNDEDEVECFQCLQQTGQPDYVVTEFVDIRRSLAAHFFIHPSGDITWFGTSENVRQPSANGRCSDDATIWNMKQQETLRKLMTP
jgi:biotin carboxylase